MIIYDEKEIFKSVEEMCKHHGYNCQNLGFDRWLVNNGELMRWKVVKDRHKKLNRKTGEVEIFKWTLYHESLNPCRGAVDHDGFHKQRAFMDLNYLGDYLKTHILFC